MKLLEFESDVGEEFEVKSMLEYGEELFSKCDLTGYFEVSGQNVNWRGHRFEGNIRRIKSFDDLLKKLSGYGDYSARFEFYPKLHYIKCRISHHDCPNGSFFDFDAVNKKRYKKLEMDGEI